jgi:iron complex outermembrane receptor protein
VTVGKNENWRIRYQWVAIAAALACSGTTAAQETAKRLADLSLEELSSLEITSVSGRAESLRDAPASVYVITGDDIRRSAATTLPQALRLAPNLQVAQLNSGQYSISARGFNNAIGNKLLVLIDGRTIYSALFSGVFWDANDIVLEDIDRIEVVSGPGGTLWGANAVNGVINVITKPASATQGALAATARSSRGGYETARWGGTFGDSVNYRVYALALDRGDTSRADGFVRPDSSARKQFGFRTDWSGRAGSFTVQGDAYNGGEFPANNLAPKLSGANLLTRWKGEFSGGSPFTVQAYVDHAKRDDVTAFRDTATTFDVQFTHEPQLTEGQELLWGAGYRRTRDTDERSPVIVFIPAERTLDWSSVFAQYGRQLGKSIELTLGAKAERNVYSGLEFLPNARLAYKHENKALTWAALSRAVRAPARLDRDFFSPGSPPFLINGGPAFDSEIANVIEIGHRGFAPSGISYSVTAFRQRYERLRSGSSAPPITLVNQIEGHVDGIEAWASWQATQAWRLSAGALGLRKHLNSTRGTPDPTGVANLGNDPREQFKLRSSWNFAGRGELDVIMRHIGALPSPAVEAYTAVDARLAWQLTPRVELSLLGQNLFDRRHVEFNAVGAASQIERRLFIKAAWRL